MYKQPLRLHQKLLESINEFCKVIGYKINGHKSIVFLYINNAQWKTISFTIVSKSIIYPAMNFDKGGERLVHWKLKVSDKKN